MTDGNGSLPIPAALPASLRWRWWAYAAACLATWCAALWFLQRQLPVDQGRAWGIASGTTLAYVLLFSYRHLPLNHRAGETALLEVFGPGDVVTLVRGLLIGLLAGFLLLPRPAYWLAWIPAVLYSLVEVGDFLDGYLARATRTATRWGERLDIEFDALGLLMAAGLAAHWGTVATWFLTVGASRYAYLLGLWWVHRRGGSLYPLPPSGMRRPIAGVMLIFASVLLWPILPPAAARAAAWVISLPFLAGFLRDWLVASGNLSPASPSYLRARARVKGVLTEWAPLFLRSLVLVSWVWAARQAFPGVSQEQPGAGLVVLSVIPVMLVALGVAGRLAALGVVILNGLAMALAEVTPPLLVLMTASLATLLTGTGRRSLWRGDAWVVDWRPGAQTPKAE
jgi:CDP-diacylglycerol---glycerol-3-phosphate 3-phosphatidyltransferase